MRIRYMFAFRGDRYDISNLEEWGGVSFVLANRENKQRFELAKFFLDKGLDVNTFGSVFD